jgi:hypothetical protein
VTLSVSSIPRPHEDWKVIKQSVYLQGTGMNILMHLFIRNRYGKFNALKNVYPEHNFKNGILPRIKSDKSFSPEFFDDSVGRLDYICTELNLNQFYP